MKIVHMPGEIAGQIKASVDGLRALGENAISVIVHKNKYYSDYDYCFTQDVFPSTIKRRLYKLMLFLKILFTVDIIHYHFGQAYYGESRFDMKIFKLFHKKMVMEFWGSDIRKPTVAKALNPFYVNAAEITDEETIKRQHDIAKYISHVIVSDYEMVSYVESCFKTIDIIPQRINLSKYIPQYPDSLKSVPLIIHASSSRAYKGTEIIISTLKLLKKKHSFKFELIENMSHEEAIMRYREADIIIDEIRTGAYGIFAIEAMAFGKPVICYIRSDLTDKYPSGLPIISANPNTFSDSIEKLILDGELRSTLGKKGRKYVEENHDSKKVALRLMEIYKVL